MGRGDFFVCINVKTMRERGIDREEADNKEEAPAVIEEALVSPPVVEKKKYNMTEARLAQLQVARERALEIRHKKKIIVEKARETESYGVDTKMEDVTPSPSVTSAPPVSTAPAGSPARVLEVTPLIQETTPQVKSSFVKKGKHFYFIDD